MKKNSGTIVLVLVGLVFLCASIGVVIWGATTNWWGLAEETPAPKSPSGGGGSPTTPAGPAGPRAPPTPAGPAGPRAPPTPAGPAGPRAPPTPAGPAGPQVPGTPPTPVGPQTPTNIDLTSLIGKTFTCNGPFSQEKIIFVDSTNLLFNDVSYVYSITTFMSTAAIRLETATHTYFLLQGVNYLDMYSIFGNLVCRLSGSNTVVPSSTFSMTDYIGKTYTDGTTTVQIISSSQLLYNGINVSYNVLRDPLFRYNIINLDSLTLIELASSRVLQIYKRFSVSNLFTLISNLVAQASPGSAPSGGWPPVVSAVRENLAPDGVMGDISLVLQSPLPIGASVASVNLQKANGINLSGSGSGIWNPEMTKLTFRVDLTRASAFQINITFTYNGNSLTFTTNSV